MALNDIKFWYWICYSTTRIDGVTLTITKGCVKINKIINKSSITMVILYKFLYERDKNIFSMWTGMVKVFTLPSRIMWYGRHLTLLVFLIFGQSNDQKKKLIPFKTHMTILHEFMHDLVKRKGNWLFPHKRYFTKQKINLQKVKNPGRKKTTFPFLYEYLNPLLLFTVMNSTLFVGFFFLLFITHIPFLSIPNATRIRMA